MVTRGVCVDTLKLRLGCWADRVIVGVLWVMVAAANTGAGVGIGDALLRGKGRRRRRGVVVVNVSDAAGEC